jgi:hypothetical protein
VLQARFSQRHGCMGLVLYSDPSDYAPEGVGVFPRGVAMPGTAVQRGNVKISSGELGDPLTPYGPAIGTETHFYLNITTG